MTLNPQNPNKPPTAQGLYQKYMVYRTDGQSARGEKHYACDYFVLDWTHDKFAIPALAAYAEACQATYPELAKDLRDIVRRALQQVFDDDKKVP